MRYEKKQITKGDGRYLVYYHFPDSATEEQAAAFRLADDPSTAPDPGSARSAPSESASAAVDKDKPSV